jgi:hypothetical protein
MLNVPTPALSVLKLLPATPEPEKLPPVGVAVNDSSDVISLQILSSKLKVITGKELTVTVVTAEVAEQPFPSV